MPPGFPPAGGTTAPHSRAPMCRTTPSTTVPWRTWPWRPWGNAPAAASPGNPDAQALINAFLEGAGLAPGRVEAVMTPEFMRNFGEAFRVAVQGTIDLLAARRNSRHEAHHAAMDALGEMIWASQRSGLPPDGHAYLDAWCHLAEAPRLFRLDRVVSAEVLDEPIATEPAAPRDLAEGFFTRDTDVTLATVLLDPAARWVTDYYPAEAVREVGEGRLEVDFLVADQRWLTRLVLRLVPHARVLAPQEAADAVTAAAQQTLGLYT